MKQYYVFLCLFRCGRRTTSHGRYFFFFPSFDSKQTRHFFAFIFFFTWLIALFVLQIKCWCSECIFSWNRVEFFSSHIYFTFFFPFASSFVHVFFFFFQTGGNVTITLIEDQLYIHAPFPSKALRTILFLYVCVCARMEAWGQCHVRFKECNSFVLHRISELPFLSFYHATHTVVGVLQPVYPILFCLSSYLAL